MIICGIDASSSCTGVCIFDNRELVYYNKFRPYKAIDFRHNICEIIDQVTEVVNLYCPDVIYMEDVPKYINKGKGAKPLIALGAVQGIFYQNLAYQYGYNIEYVSVIEWREKLGFLKGAKKREKQKAKAVDFVNARYGLHLYFDENSKTMKNDDDIAEAICIAVSQMV